VFLAEEPNQSPSFITNDEGGDTTSDLQVDHDGRSATALDPTSEIPGPIEGNQHTLDSMVSDEDHFERTMRQSAERGSEGLDRNANLRLCITGEFVGQSNLLILKTVIVRPPSSMCNGKVRLSIPQLSQTRHFWIWSRGGEGFIAGKGLSTDMEAAVAC